MSRLCFLCTAALNAGKTVCIIGPVKIGKHYLHNIGLQSARRELIAKHIPFFVHFKVEDEGDQTPNKKEIK
jgi:hypothetical protein